MQHWEVQPTSFVVVIFSKWGSEATTMDSFHSVKNAHHDLQMSCFVQRCQIYTCEKQQTAKASPSQVHLPLVCICTIVA